MENLTKKEIMEKAMVFNTNKTKKEYLLFKGSLPKENTKATPINTHSYIIANAILSLIEEGKEKANRDTIMEKALSLGLYEAKPSKSSPSYIFSWWFSSLKNYGFIA